MDITVIMSGVEWFIQDGVTALRSPLGELLSEQPQFIKISIEELRAMYGNTSVQKFTLKSGAKLQEIGSKTERSSTGKFLPQKSLYILKPEEEINPKTGNAFAEEKLLTDIAKVMGAKMKQYIHGGGKLEKKRKIKI